MKSFSKMLLPLVIASQFTVGCPNYRNPKIENDKKIAPIEMKKGPNIKKTSKETINVLEASIVFFTQKRAPVFKDLKSKEIVGYLPSGVFLKNSMIDVKLSNDEFVCISIKGHKSWISKNDLLKSTPEIEKTFFQPKTEKSILVDKKNRQIEVYDQYGKHLVKKFSIALSSWGNDNDKTISGDGETPEGKYYICHKNSISSFGTNPKTGGRMGSLMVSYPNMQDGAEGVLSGDISWQEFGEIKNAVNNKSIPSQNTNLGNYIMIHGGGSGQDWTAGCIGLDDENMLRLYSFIHKGTDLIIK